MTERAESHCECPPDGAPVPLLPLWETVLLPGQLLPVRLIEANFAQLAETGPNEDCLVATALVQPAGTASRSDSQPPVHPIGCLSRVMTTGRSPQPPTTIVLEGLRRVGLHNPRPSREPHRLAELEPLPDQEPDCSSFDGLARQRALLAAFRELFSEIEIDRVLGPTLGEHQPLGSLCDLLAAALPLPTRIAQDVLAEVNIELRSELVLDQLRRFAADSDWPACDWLFPPTFSTN